MDNITVIGLSGRAGSGKDYISQHILRPMGYHQFSLAWHFKVWAVGRGQATHEEVFHTKPPHVRHILQQVGTEQGRNIYGEDIWCNTVKEWFIVLNEQWGINKFCIPDVRFKNEVEFIQNMGGRVFRIEAPIREASSSLTPEARLHISETALDDYPHNKFDAIIRNDPNEEHTIKEQIDILLKSEWPQWISTGSPEWDVDASI